MINVTLNKETHTYMLDDGTVVPATHDILETTGISNVSSIPPYILEKAQRRGTIIHTLLEYYDKDILDEYDKSLQGYIDQWQLFKNQYKIKQFTLIEKPLVSVLGFATTLDRYVDGIIIDIKSGQFYPSYQIQTASHKIVVEENLKEKVHTRLIVQITDKNFKVTPCTEEGDVDVFKGALKVFHWRKKNERN